MKEKCCDIKVERTKDGVCIKLTGDDAEGRCKELLGKCCSEEELEKCFEECCTSEECCPTQKCC